MQYKIMCTYSLWKPDTGIKLWKVDSDGKQVWPRGEPTPAPPIPMKNEDDFIKGLSSFIDLWESLAQRDHTGSYARSHGDLIIYWKDVRDALKLPLPPLQTSLINGFWLSTHIQISDTIPLSHDEIVREEFADDEPFIGPVAEQPRSSFQVARDVYKGYMLLIRPGDEAHPKPVWVALALSNPVLTSTSEYFQKIKVQYFMPTSKTRAIQESYVGWDTKQTMKWKAASNEPPCWIHTSCILTAWKKWSTGGSICIPHLQVQIAKDNLVRCEEADAVNSDSSSQ
jgi:hypothetical protein